MLWFWLVARAAFAQPTFVYPPANHTTSAASIFFIGSAPAAVTVNGELIRQSPNGHFAPSFPLDVGLNTFVFESGGATVQRTVTRVGRVQALPRDRAVIAEVIPNQERWLQPDEPLCFTVLGTPNANVTLELWQHRFLMPERPEVVVSADASDSLLGQDQPQRLQQPGRYHLCVSIPEHYRGQETTAAVSLEWQGQTSRSEAATVRVLPSQPIQLAVANENFTVSRSGPGGDFSRLSPWPEGVGSPITGLQEGWFRTASDQWLAHAQAEIRVVDTPPFSTISNVSVQTEGEWTVLRVPLTERLPYQVQQEPGQVILDIDHARVHSHFMALDINNPLVRTLTWAQVTPERARYVFHLETDYVWGYEADYDGTTLVLRLRQQPQINRERPLEDLVIVLDPGHGGPEDSGALGPNGLPEKDLVLVLSERLRLLLEAAGAIVHTTRDRDIDVPLQARADIQRRLKPHLFISLHYNALPDAGQAETTSGIGTFWYHPHSRPLAQALQTTLPGALDQANYGEFFASFFVIRETYSPAVLLELGFMINPWEFEQISQTPHQEATAIAIVETLADYLQSL